MSYTREWDNTAPLGSAQASTIDDIIRNLKVDIEERMQEWLGVVDMAETGSQAAPAVTFGAWLSRSMDTVYEALTDGFVVAYVGISSSTSHRRATLYGRTDASSPPTTLRAACHADHTLVNAYNSFTMPVKKDDYWKVTKETYGGDPTTKIYWIPQS